MFPKFIGLEYATIMQRMEMWYPVLFWMEVRAHRFGNHWEGGYFVVAVSCNEGPWKGYYGE
eukprot:11335822-Ditylum_brightwellii.AAC.1